MSSSRTSVVSEDQSEDTKSEDIKSEDIKTTLPGKNPTWLGGPFSQKEMAQDWFKKAQFGERFYTKPGQKVSLC